MRLSLPSLVLAAAFAAAGCDSAAPPEPDLSRRFRVEIANVAPAFGILKSGSFSTPVGASAPGPIGPGGAYEFSFTAGTNVTPGSGMRLSFATMFIQSNDLFYTFPGAGLPLYDAQGRARTGDVTSEVRLYDAGTEVNETPGMGPNQAPRQTGAGAGTPENGTLGRINDGQPDRAGFTYPSVASVIRVTLAHDGDTRFTVRIANVSTMNTLALPGGGSVAVPLSPGGWAVHTDAVAFFTAGSPASEGIRAIAEDGEVGPLAADLGPRTGVTVPLSPGTAAVHTSAVPFFTTGSPSSAGLEDIAEDGEPGVLTAALTGLAGIRQALSFATPVGASAPAPIGPGGSYAFEVSAEPGDRLSFATMYIQTNDFFLAPEGAGLPLFSEAGVPLSGDVTAQVFLWDAGTEVDEEPGVGRFQATRQPGPDTGTPENGRIVRVDGTNDGFAYPPASAVVRVTVTPLGV